MPFCQLMHPFSGIFTFTFLVVSEFLLSNLSVVQHQECFSSLALSYIFVSSWCPIPLEPEINDILENFVILMIIDHGLS